MKRGDIKFIFLLFIMIFSLFYVLAGEVNDNININDNAINTESDFIDNSDAGIYNNYNNLLLSDRKSPRIARTFPGKYKFTNGNYFMVKYTEDNLKEIRLNIDHKNFTKNDCESGRNQICNFNVNLSNYDGMILSYYFFIEDRSGNRKYSKLTPVIVDTNPPIITDIANFINGRKVTLIISFEENNLDVIEYKDNQDSTPKWRTFCTHGVGGKCEKRISFNGNDGPDLLIRITDKAGNIFERHV